MPASAPTSRSWFARNALWVVPAGCLGLLAALAAFAGLVLTLVMGGIKSTDAYHEAVDRASASPLVHTALGEPVKIGWFVSGNVNVSGPSGEADLSIPLSGPQGKGTLYVTARKQAGRWQYQVLEVAVEGRPARIDLMSDN